MNGLQPLGAVGAHGIKEFNGVLTERHHDADPVDAALVDGDDELV